jgi:hypothetical protein
MARALDEKKKKKLNSKRLFNFKIKTIYKFIRVKVWSQLCPAVRLLPDKSRPPDPV